MLESKDDIQGSNTLVKHRFAVYCKVSRENQVSLGKCEAPQCLGRSGQSCRGSKEGQPLDNTDNL
ncbi:MAG: hypothetical protein ACM37W_11910 [Actinomycetota bacterium]